MVAEVAGAATGAASEPTVEEAAGAAFEPKAGAAAAGAAAAGAAAEGAAESDAAGKMFIGRTSPVPGIITAGAGRPDIGCGVRRPCFDSALICDWMTLSKYCGSFVGLRSAIMFPIRINSSTLEAGRPDAIALARISSIASRVLLGSPLLIRGSFL